MTNKVLKTLIKALANAPEIAAQQARKELADPAEKAELERILTALKINGGGKQ